ncbi:MAG: hypothetical protein IKW60_02665 [Clostridia bacterium]|nr:hypothetical protein [Clostridia bacterium]
MLKRFVSSLVGVACLVSMTGAFAANYTGTTTEYDVSGKIRVKSSVSGVQDEVVTYLVHDADATVATLQDNQVVYVDQYEFVETTTYTFNYLTDSDDITATVLLGGDVTGTKQDTVGAKVIVNGADKYIADVEGSAGYVLVPYTAVGDVVTAVTLNSNVLDAKEGDWFAGANGLYITGLKLDGTDVITYSTGETVSASVATLDAAYLSADQAADEQTTASVLAVGKVTGDVAEFGIVINYVDENDEKKSVSLKALGKNEAGNYAVRVYTDDFKGKTGVTVQAYYKTTADGVAQLGDAIPILQ